jgi:hypothetical protein
MDNKTRRIEALPMGFKISLAERMRAAAGLPAFIRRKRRIEDLEQATLQALDEIYEDALGEAQGDRGAALEAFRARARELDLGLINDLVDRHNRYYPIEANLPIDVQTGQVMMGSEPWEPLEPVTCDGLVARVLAGRSGE